MAENRIQKGKITLGDLGEPSLVKSIAVDKLIDGKRLFLGTLFGRVDDFVERTDPKEQTKFEGLKGSIVAQKVNPETGEIMEEIESGVLFLPDAFHNLIADKLREAQKATPGASLDFALHAFSVAAKNPAGYSREMLPAMPYVGKHPLDDLMAKVKALPAPGSNVKRLETAKK